MKWIKWWVNSWLQSTCRDQLTTAERATFHDMVCLSAVDEPFGSFKFHSYQALARKFNTPTEVIESTIEKCLQYGRIILNENEIGEQVCCIVEWDRYQPVKAPNKRKEKIHKKKRKDIDKIRLDKTRGKNNKKQKLSPKSLTEEFLKNIEEPLRTWIQKLYQIPQFQISPQRCTEYLREKLAHYSEEIIASALESFVDKKLYGEKLTSSPLGQLTTYIKNEYKWCREKVKEKEDVWAQAEKELREEGEIP